MGERIRQGIHNVISDIGPRVGPAESVERSIGRLPASSTQALYTSTEEKGVLTRVEYASCTNTNTTSNPSAVTEAIMKDKTGMPFLFTLSL